MSSFSQEIKRIESESGEKQRKTLSSINQQFDQLNNSLKNIQSELESPYNEDEESPQNIINQIIYYRRNPYSVSNKARVAKLSKVTMRPYDYAKFQNRLGQPAKDNHGEWIPSSTMKTHNSVSSEKDEFMVKPMFNKKGFGRDLFVTENNEIIRELGENQSEEGSYFELNNSQSEHFYKRRISQKPVTGVRFYQKDLKTKEISQKLAFRRIKMIQSIQYQLPHLNDTRSVTSRDHLINIKNMTTEPSSTIRHMDRKKMSWSNPAHQKRLEEFQTIKQQQNLQCVQNLSLNMENIQDALQNPDNFKNFYWTPDLNVYGFAKQGQIIETLDQYKKVGRRLNYQRNNIID